MHTYMYIYIYIFLVTYFSKSSNMEKIGFSPWGAAGGEISDLLSVFAFFWPPGYLLTQESRSVIFRVAREMIKNKQKLIFQELRQTDLCVCGHPVTSRWLLGMDWERREGHKTGC